jgi:hypothetical protein
MGFTVDENKQVMGRNEGSIRKQASRLTDLSLRYSRRVLVQ